MHAALLLFLYAVLAGVVADRWLVTTPWVGRAPSAALVLWHAVAFSVLGSLLAACYLLAHDVFEHSLASVLHADKGLLHAAYAPPRETSRLWNVAVLGAVVLLLMLAISAVRGYRAARRSALRHQIAVTGTQTVALQGQRRHFGVIDSGVPAVYCLAAGPAHGRILVTRAALERLPKNLLSPAITHEQAHLRHRHHLQLIAARAIHASTRRVGLLMHYPESVAALAELEADDAAAEQHGTRAVAAALLELGQYRSTNPHPGGLFMAEVNAASRIRRLLEGEQPRPATRWTRRPAIAFAIAAVASAVPLAAALGPAVALSGTAPDHRPSPPLVTQTGFAHHP